MEERGFDVVEEALKQESYPMDDHEINYAVGDIEVEDGHGGFIPVRRLTDSISGKRFDSAEAVVEALKKAAKQGKLSREDAA